MSVEIKSDTTYKRLKVKPQSCIGCLNCEKACAYRHHGVFDQAYSRINVHLGETEEGPHVPVVCLHCAEAACAKVCPTGANFIDAGRGVVDHDSAKCIRCNLCVTACPFGNMLYVPKTQNEVHKCDLCSGEPFCAVFCPTDALTWE
jgi:Fe-S-cluster-containing hydrogenase component 2